jgi:hypothetical protein
VHRQVCGLCPPRFRRSAPRSPDVLNRGRSPVRIYVVWTLLDLPEGVVVYPRFRVFYQPSATPDVGLCQFSCLRFACAEAFSNQFEL